MKYDKIAIVTKLNGQRLAAGWTAKCPSHEDNRPSLSLSESSTGKLLWKCHAGCSQMAVFEALVKIGVLPGKRGGAN